MDIAAPTIAEIISRNSTNRTAEAAQLLVLKKAMALQQQGAAALLQTLPAALPLATSGSLGTRLNVLA